MNDSLLWLLACMLASQFPERLSVGLVTAVHKSGDNSDMSVYRGISVGSAKAKLFGMVFGQGIAVWAKGYAAKAKGQAGSPTRLTTYWY